MLTFKQFLNSQADDIEDMEAVRKYQEYKLEFRKTQIATFFTTHKDEEWYVDREMDFNGFNTCLTIFNIVAMMLCANHKLISVFIFFIPYVYEANFTLVNTFTELEANFTTF